MTLAPVTEKVVLDLLRARCTKPGNGGSGEYAFLTHVRDGAAFDAKRTFDAVAVSLWPSRGLTIDIYEVKVSRADWLRELSNPEKAEAAFRVADRFWIAAPVGVVKHVELPPGWGLIEVVDGKSGRRLRAAVQAELTHTEKTRTKPISRGLLVGLLRSAPGAVATNIPVPEPAEIKAARQQGYKEGVESIVLSRESWVAKHAELMGRVREFERLLGVSTGILGHFGERDAAMSRVASALSRVLNDEAILASCDEALRVAKDRLTRALQGIEGGEAR